MKQAFLAILLFLQAPLLQAQEVSVFLGGTMQSRTDDVPFAGQIEYKQHETDAFAWSLSYFNEGHFPGHHRDIYLGQLWLGTGRDAPGFSLAAGIGPHYYFDTVSAGDGSYSNEHGWGLVASLTAGWQTENNWLFQVRTNWVEAIASSDRFSLMAGIGYRLAPWFSTEATSRQQYPDQRNNEVTVFLGRSIINSFQSEPATAASIEYRRTLLPYLDGTVSWLYEGHNEALTRNGFCGELWVTTQFLEHRLGLGAGGGLYQAVDLDIPGMKNGSRLSFILSATASYRLGQRWDTRVIFHRIVTNYDKDSDVILGGVGYRF